MPAEVGQPHSPTLLNQVEQRIGLDFFANKELEQMAHTSPGSLPPSEFEPRLVLYTAGLRVLAQEQRAEHSSTTDPSLAERLKDQVADIRGGLMLLDPGLQTPAVRGLREAMQRINLAKAPNGQRDGHRRKPADILPPDVMPVGAVDRMLNVGNGSTRVSLGYHGLEPAARLKLPGPARSEVCVDWRFISGMAKRHGFRDPEFDIDWERLPQGPEDTDPKRVAYAREIQNLYVTAYKLINVPELEGRVQLELGKIPTATAQQQHISQSILSRLMGGGYHFAQDYCTANNISFRYLRRPDHFGDANYLVLEDAAAVWAAYKEIPRADASHHTSVIELTRQLGFTMRRATNENLLPQEKAHGQLMRAVKPAGRVIEHLPVEVAEQVKARVAPINLPPHLLPVNVIDKIIPLTYSAIMQRFGRMGPGLHPPTPLRLLGARQTHDCYDWQAVRHLAVRYEDKLLMGIAWSRLPRGPHDTDPGRIAYARSIQEKIVPPKMLDTAAATRTHIPVFDGTARTELSVTEVIPYRSHMRPLQAMLDQLPPGQRPSMEAAIHFLHEHGAQPLNTNHGPCVLGISAGLINYNFHPGQYEPQNCPATWLTRNELADRTGQTLGQIDADLARVDWAAMRKKLESTHLKDHTVVSGRSQSTVHVLWGRDRGTSGAVLPHYNPAIVARIDEVAAQRAAEAKRQVRKNGGAATPPAPPRP